VTVPIEKPGQNGYLTFTATEGQRVSLRSTSGTILGYEFGCDVNVSIVRNSDNSVVANPTCMEGSGFIDQVTLTAGSYTIVVDPVEEATGNLPLTLYDVPDVTGTVTINGAALPVSLAPGQNANVTFAGAANQSIRVPVTTPGAGTCAAITVLRQDNSTVVATYSACGASIQLPSTNLPATETYHIVLDPSSTANGSFTISVASP
jgi:hypothetical protein